MLRQHEPTRVAGDKIDDVHDDNGDEIDEFEAGEYADADEQHAEFAELLNAPQNPTEFASDLGSRPIDLGADWTPYIGKYAQDVPGLFVEDFWLRQKDVATSRLEVGTQPSPAYRGLNAEQKLLYTTIKDHYSSILDGSLPPQLLVNLDGRAGTGKSFAIRLLSSTLESMQKAHAPTRICSPVIRLAPTGAAAFQIQGFTIHSFFRIPVQRGDVLTPLSPDGIRELQLKLEGVAYLVIDEKSMLSLTMLAWLDQRLRQVYPATNTQFFGGLSIVLAGDFFQLPPVGGLPLFDNRETRSSIALSGYCAYCAFDRTIRLTTIVRQSSTAEASFRQTLDAVRMSQVNLANFNTLIERIPSRLPLLERQAFEATAVHLLPTRRLVAEFNYTRLRDTGCPVLPVHARHSSPSCASIDSEEFGGLVPTLLLTINCRIMLLENIWTECGLVNGSRGTLCDVVWPTAATQPREEMPLCLLLHFESYTGPPIGFDLPGIDSSKIVPVYPSRRSQVQPSTSTRTSGRWRQQFPVSLAYAITIHKSQGMTLDRAVVDVKSRGFPRPLGLLYVALSRVRRLQDLMFFTDITLDDLQPRVSMQVERRLMDEQRRRSQILMPPLHRAPVQTPSRHLDFPRALPDRSTPRQTTRDGTDFEPGSESRRLEF